MLPRRFGPYVLLDRIATGGMGEVYLAASRPLPGFEKLCAVKRILPSLAREEEFLARFRDEARLVSSMRHPNVVAVNDMGRVGQEWFMAMELVDGHDLGALLTRCWHQRRWLAVSTALYIMRELLVALDYCHRHTDETGVKLRLVHRDISPANVLISFDGGVKLADFGLALSTMKLVRTHPHVLLGKPGYIAPERLLGGAVDHRADLYCAGVLLYELLTCERYARSCEPRSLLQELTRRSHLASSVRHDVPAAVDDLLARALAVNPDQRFSSARQFWEAVQRVLAEMDPLAGPWNIAELMSDQFDHAEERRRVLGLVRAGMALLAEPAGAPPAQVPREVTVRRFGLAETAPTVIDDRFDDKTQSRPLELSDEDFFELTEGPSRSSRSSRRSRPPHVAPSRPAPAGRRLATATYRATRSGRLLRVEPSGGR